MCYQEHSVKRLNFYLKDKQLVIYEDHKHIYDVVNMPFIHKSKFLSWMDANKKFNEANDLIPNFHWNLCGKNPNMNERLLKGGFLLEEFICSSWFWWNNWVRISYLKTRYCLKYLSKDILHRQQSLKCLVILVYYFFNYPIYYLLFKLFEMLLQRIIRRSIEDIWYWDVITKQLLMFIRLSDNFSTTYIIDPWMSKPIDRRWTKLLQTKFGGGAHLSDVNNDFKIKKSVWRDNGKVKWKNQVYFYFMVMVEHGKNLIRRLCMSHLHQKGYCTNSLFQWNCSITNTWCKNSTFKISININIDECETCYIQPKSPFAYFIAKAMLII